MKRDNPEKILILFSSGGEYGSGHFRRMQLLANALSPFWPVEMTRLGESSGISEDSRVCILDSRDDAFPDAILENKKPGQLLIAIDNRGTGRAQADCSWDTLPHFEMNPAELATSLEHFILNPFFLDMGKGPSRSDVRLIRGSIDDARTLGADLLHEPGSSGLSENEFRKKLLEARTIATYFGQTFFEALYLEKTIYLYPVSKYHARLSEWFTAMLKKDPGLVRHLDGQGLNRLVQKIREFRND